MTQQRQLPPAAPAVSRRIEFGLRVALGAIFLYAAATKLLHPDQFAENLLDYGLLPERTVNLVAVWLPSFELVVGVLVAAGMWVRAGALAMAGMSVAFLAGLVWVISGPTSLPCSCFSTDPGAPARTWGSLWQEGVLMLMALTLWVTHWQQPEDHPVHLRRRQIMGLAVAVLVVALLLGSVVAVRVHRTHEALSTAEATPLAGAVGDLSSAAAGKQPLPRLLELAVSTCGHCQEMAPIVAQLTQDLQGKVTVQVVDLVKTQGAAEKYNVAVTPTFIFFNAQGTQVGRREGTMSREEMLSQLRKLGMLKK